MADSLGIKVAANWFAQRVGWLLQNGTAEPHAKPLRGPRVFTEEYNVDLARELQEHVDVLKESLQMGLGVQEACFEIGACALAIAVNTEKGVGKKPPARKVVKTVNKK